MKRPSINTYSVQQYVLAVEAYIPCDSLHGSSYGVAHHLSKSDAAGTRRFAESNRDLTMIFDVQNHEVRRCVFLYLFQPAFFRSNHGDVRAGSGRMQS